MHRRRVPPPGESLSVEDEMKKRAFWLVVSSGRSLLFLTVLCRALLFLDRTTGLQMGRPSAIQDVEYVQQGIPG
jgi:hypothetical protein